MVNDQDKIWFVLAQLLFDDGETQFLEKGRDKHAFEFPRKI